MRHQEHQGRDERWDNRSLYQIAIFVKRELHCVHVDAGVNKETIIDLFLAAVVKEKLIIINTGSMEGIWLSVELFDLLTLTLRDASSELPGAKKRVIVVEWRKMKFYTKSTFRPYGKTDAGNTGLSGSYRKSVWNTVMILIERRTKISFWSREIIYQTMAKLIVYNRKADEVSDDRAWVFMSCFQESVALYIPNRYTSFENAVHYYW